MDKEVLAELRNVMSQRRDADTRYQEAGKKLEELETLQTQTVINLSDAQYREIAKAVDEQQKVVEEVFAELHNAEFRALDLVEELLDSIL